MEGLLILIGIGVAYAAAVVLGKDSRDGNDWRWHPRP